MTGPQGGFALFLAAALLCLVLPVGAARIAAARRGKPWGGIYRDLLLCAGFGAAAFFLVGSWLLFGADAGGILGLPPGASLPAGQAGIMGRGGAQEAGAASFFLYHLGLCLVPFWMFYAVNGERLTRAGNALMCVVVCLLVFPVAGHWTVGQRWLGAPGAGWLAARGFCDAAGGVAALVCGGAAALAGMLGGAPLPARQPQDDAPGWGIALVSWLLAASLAAGASGGHVVGALIALGLGGVCGALAAKAASVAARAGGRAGLRWLGSLLATQGRALTLWRENLGADEAVGLAAGVAALSGALSVAPWWAIPLLGALAGGLAWTGLYFLGALLDLAAPARRCLALGLGAAVGAVACALVALPQPALYAPGLFVAGGPALAGIELTGAAATAAWTIAIVWLVQRALRRAQRALASLPGE